MENKMKYVNLFGNGKHFGRGRKRLFGVKMVHMQHIVNFFQLNNCFHESPSFVTGFSTQIMLIKCSCIIQPNQMYISYLK